MEIRQQQQKKTKTRTKKQRSFFSIYTPIRKYTRKHRSAIEKKSKNKITRKKRLCIEE